MASVNASSAIQEHEEPYESARIQQHEQANQDAFIQTEGTGKELDDTTGNDTTENRKTADIPSPDTNTRKTRHERAQKLSYELLDNARKSSQQSRNGTRENPRDTMAKLVAERCGYDAHCWQLDVAEAVWHQLNTIVIAGTGEGKTLPFVMPLLSQEKKCVVIISPLIALQDDQVQRFSKMKLPAVAVNGDTWSPSLQKELEEQKYRVILTSPEMSLKHKTFRATLSDAKFSKSIIAYIVDECHCISQWGGDFRPTYRDLNELRAFVPRDIPILATSATLPPDALADTRKTLGMDINSTFFLNLGNRRSNLHFSAHKMKGKSDFEVLKRLFLKIIKTAGDIPLTMIFTDGRMKTQDICAYIRTLLPPELHDAVGYYNALMSPESKRYIMEQFRKGVIRILVTTEAAGMGCDIPNIERVVQHGVPQSLSVWMQRAGRAGRSRDIHAEAVLLYEASIFKIRKRKNVQTNEKKRRTKVITAPPLEEESSSSEAENNEDDSNVTYQKSVEPSMRAWIETAECREVVQDDYFDNPPRPPRTQRTIGDCCDNCDAKITAAGRHIQPASSGNTPSSKRHRDDDDGDAEGKRSRKKAKTNKTRVQSVQAEAEVALKEWRMETKKIQYPSSSFSAMSIIPDRVIQKLVRNAEVNSTDDLMEVCDGCWVFASKHGEEVLSILKNLDRAHEDELRARNEERKRKTAAEKAERERIEAVERAQREYMKMVARAQRQHVQKARTRQRAPKIAALDPPSPFIVSAPPPLINSSLFNVRAHAPPPSTSTMDFEANRDKTNDRFSTFALSAPPPLINSTPFNVHAHAPPSSTSTMDFQANTHTTSDQYTTFASPTPFLPMQTPTTPVRTPAMPAPTPSTPMYRVGGLPWPPYQRVHTMPVHFYSTPNSTPAPQPPPQFIHFVPPHTPPAGR